MARLPIFKAGDRLSALSATEMNALVRAVRPLLNLTVRRKDGLLIKKSESGIEIGLNLATIIDPPKTPQAIRSVAIVETINDEHTSMQVREVGYAKSPPESALVFKGESFEAYSYFGDATLADYKGFEFTGTTPNETTRVFDARKVDGDWILEKPSSSSGLRIAKIVSVGSSVVFVQPLRETFSGTERVLVNNGEIEAVPVWPKLAGQDYAQHIAPGVIVALMQISGVWYAYQTIPRRMKPPEQLRLSPCPQ